MNNNSHHLIQDSNLSSAWSRIFLHIIENPGKEISPLLVSLSDFQEPMPGENETIRQALNECLLASNEQEINTVANTIFPFSLWQRYRYDRRKFFEGYLATFPRYKALKPQLNGRGIYFERLIAFGAGSSKINQLEYIISEYKPGVRRSKFQASIFDPHLDHVPNPRLGFPCLQHLSFIPNNERKTLTLNAFYATQQIFNKAYGNYLGLCRLGYFMSHEMGLSFERMNCFVGVAKMDIKKTSDAIIQLASKVRDALAIEQYIGPQGK